MFGLEEMVAEDLSNSPSFLLVVAATEVEMMVVR